MAEPPPSDPPSGEVVRFGVFEVDLRSGGLRKRGLKTHVQQLPLRLLQVLLERPGEVVRREELRARLWPGDTWVDFDHGLNKAVNKLRETLGDSAENPRFIETLAKRGYRFLAPVQVVRTPAREGLPGTHEPPPAPGAAALPTDSAAQQVSEPPNRTVRYVVGLLVIAAVTGLTIARWQRSRPSPPTAERTMLAVLPFADLEADREQEYFSDGVTEEIILQLGRLNAGRLGVIARTSSMQYKNTTKRVDEIARELAVQYVLEGTVRRSGRRVRIAARLVRGADQTPLWSDSYDRNPEDIFDIQSDVARRIAESLSVELLAGSAGTPNDVPRAEPAAHDAYLRGRYYWNRRGPADLDRAVALLEEAVARDPSFVPAATALADALNVLPWYGLRSPQDVYPRSKEIAKRALALDERSAAAHTALAYAYHYYDWDWDGAEREYRRAVELDPNYAQAHQWLAAHYAELMRTDDALAEMRLAQRLDPRSTIISAAIGWINYLGRRYGPAAQQLEATIAGAPEFVPARLWMGQTLEALGRPEEAVGHYKRVREIVGGTPTGLGELARGYAVAGRFGEARETLGELLAMAPSRYVEPDVVARAYEALGDRHEALSWLQRGFDDRAVKMVLIGADPQFDRLRGDPHFDALVRRLRLPPRR
jgi:TolB-like protein/DNA-binding winged helix-turn-helix (wHTH) protein/tetratricopeptide (TPR) repeat protein